MLFSILMLIICSIGIYGVVEASNKAAQAQAEVERILKEKQEEIEREKALALAEQVRLRAQREAAILEFKEEAAKWNGYSDASEILLTGVGDSVVVASSQALMETFPNGYFDAKYARKIGTGISILKSLKDKGQLGDVVFVSLITNYSFEVTKEDIQTIIELCEGRPVFFTTTYGIHDQSPNQLMISVCEQYENAYVVDWQRYADPHPEWIMSDGLHPNEEGAIQYAKLLHDTIQEALFPSEEEIEEEVRKIYGEEKN